MVSCKNNLLHLHVAFVGTGYLNADMCAFEASQKHQSRAQLADSSKAFTAKRELPFVDVRRVIFYSWCRQLNEHCTPLKLTHYTLSLHFQKLEWKTVVGQFALEYLNKHSLQAGFIN